MTLDERGQGEDGRDKGGKEAQGEGCVSGERHVGFVEKSAIAYVLSYVFILRHIPFPKHQC